MTEPYIVLVEQPKPEHAYQTNDEVPLHIEADVLGRVGWRDAAIPDDQHLDVETANSYVLPGDLNPHDRRSLKDHVEVHGRPVSRQRIEEGPYAGKEWDAPVGHFTDPAIWD